MKFRVALLAAVLLPAAAQAGQALSPDQGAKIYQRCAACHLPNGQGVPGAFPALAGRTPVAAESAEGRDYLVMVVAAGSMGQIDVDGKKLMGVMPAQAGLTDADIAAVINHTLAFTPAGEGAAAPKLFDAAEVAEIRARHKGATPTTVHQLRGEVFATPHADAK